MKIFVSAEVYGNASTEIGGNRIEIGDSSYRPTSFPKVTLGESRTSRLLS